MFLLKMTLHKRFANGNISAAVDTVGPVSKLLLIWSFTSSSISLQISVKSKKPAVYPPACIYYPNIPFNNSVAFTGFAFPFVCFITCPIRNFNALSFPL